MMRTERKVRTVRLENITFPVQVFHGKLSPDERIDSLDSRVDTLRICVDVGYRHQGRTLAEKMDNVWNYGSVYEMLCLSGVPMIDGPLEGILDKAMAKVCESINAQGLQAEHVAVTADRMGLSVGYPHLGTARIFGESPSQASPSSSRTVQIKNQPMVVHVDHSWCRGDQRVEHVDLRTEALAVSFAAVTASQELAESDLSGLFNYAGLIHALSGMQNMALRGPVEEVCDILADMLEREASKLKVQLLQTSVEVRRPSYARCTPVLGLQTWYRRKV